MPILLDTVTLATRNTAGFASTGIALLKPWDFGK